MVEKAQNYRVELGEIAVKRTYTEQYHRIKFKNLKNNSVYFYEYIHVW